MDIRPIAYDHPDAVKLNDQVQLEYAERYGESDMTPLDPAMFTPPRGLYLIAYDNEGFPVATGGWRAQQAGEENYADGDAELKRMYVVPAARGRALARRILALLEADARAAGRTRMVLETGTEQPEAIALYLSAGYTQVPQANRFGLYRTTDESRCFTKPLTRQLPTTPIPAPRKPLP
ncbi:GNAT family N-acetyltransferase [Streptomyces candidus]|uniref:GNAT superfamily N-acetyltransferase n=1 Tax=Streptomyces candidus TaxID=67283 RepID=A0A7X0HD92_9ACTN|nr:GNAT family N-acetyltransferase [Streptomyces candidus]MBB6435468.1 GNAT superfamily N-acetyltransferase [Streptomyces candidus]GHH47353.1 N-acetyltransferase [Streptomyces candidus]